MNDQARKKALVRLGLDAGHRDEPICFLWQSPHVLVETLGLPAAHNKAYCAARRMILAEALLAAESHQRVSYSRRRASYSGGGRYRDPAYSYVRVMAAIDELVEAGWLDEHRAKPNERGWQSSFWATPKLLMVGPALNVEPSFATKFRPTILLKDADGTMVDYVPTRQTCRFHSELKLLNAHLHGLHIDLPGAERQGLHLRIGDVLLLPIPGNGLRRIFSNGFADEGRAYGWHQNIPKSIRATLRINGQPTAEADYSAMHAAMLYEAAQKRYSGDPYDVDHFPRDLVKTGFNIAINTKSRAAAVAVISRDEGMSRSDAGKLLTAIEKRHQPISGDFFSGAGVRLMRKESDVILRALGALNRAGVGALPIHDALIAPASSIDLAEAEMVRAFETVVGRTNPCQVRIKTAKVPHRGAGGVLQAE